MFSCAFSSLIAPTLRRLPSACRQQQLPPSTSPTSPRIFIGPPPLTSRGGRTRPPHRCRRHQHSPRRHRSPIRLCRTSSRSAAASHSCRWARRRGLQLRAHQPRCPLHFDHRRQRRAVTSRPSSSKCNSSTRVGTQRCSKSHRGAQEAYAEQTSTANSNSSRARLLKRSSRQNSIFVIS
jgi:hypothetical protein